MFVKTHNSDKRGLKVSSRHCKSTFHHLSLPLWYQVTSVLRISLPNPLSRRVLGGDSSLRYNSSTLGFGREGGEGMNARCDVIPHLSAPHLSETFSNLNPVGFTSLIEKEQSVIVLGYHPGEAGGKQTCCRLLQPILSKKSLATLSSNCSHPCPQ